MLKPLKDKKLHLHVVPNSPVSEGENGSWLCGGPCSSYRAFMPKLVYSSTEKQTKSGPEKDLPQTL